MLYPEIEQQLLKVQLTNPQGDPHLSKENDEKWRAVLNRFLVDEDTMLTTNGCSGWRCSFWCLDEEENEYQFKDTARFALSNCVHVSPHLQCLLSRFIEGHSFTYCPFRDTQQCSREALYWAPEDY